MTMGVKQVQRLFQEIAALEIDNTDVKRLNDFIRHRLHDLLILGQVAASVNDRDIIEYQDIPITAGLQQAVRDFRELDEHLSLLPIFKQQVPLPPLKLAVSDMVEKKIPQLAGGITVSLARVFKAANPELKNPGSREWRQVEAIYRILL